MQKEDYLLIQTVVLHGTIPVTFYRPMEAQLDKDRDVFQRVDVIPYTLIYGIMRNMPFKSINEICQVVEHRIIHVPSSPSNEGS